MVIPAIIRPDQGRSGGVAPFFDQPEDLVDRCGLEAALREKTLLTGPFGPIGRRLVEALAPDRQRPLQLGGPHVGQRGADQRVIEPMRAQIVPDAKQTVPRRAPLHDALNEACIAEPAVTFELVEQRVELADLFGRIDMRRELAAKLGTAVFALREQPQGPRSQ